MVLVLRVGDRREEVGVAPRPAAILGRSGSLALQAASRIKTLPATRATLSVGEKSVAGLRAALNRARAEEQGAIALRLAEARAVKLEAGDADDTLDDIDLKTVAHPMLSGQVATVNKAVRYASLCAAA